jgi:hypothetical protein
LGEKKERLPGEAAVRFLQTVLFCYQLAAPYSPLSSAGGAQACLRLAHLLTPLCGDIDAAGLVRADRLAAVLDLPRPATTTSSRRPALTPPPRDPPPLLVTSAGTSHHRRRPAGQPASSPRLARTGTHGEYAPPPRTSPASSPSLHSSAVSPDRYPPLIEFEFPHSAR